MARRALADWNPDGRGPDALTTILAQNEFRAQDLLPIRHARMAASPWTYFRGAAAVMAADLASTPNTGITVQLCGDAHVLNFGLWNTPERNLSFDLRDFDETLPGPFEWDVKRLVASVVVLARDYGLSAKAARESAGAAYRGYADAIANYATMPEIDIWYDRFDVEELVGHLASYDADEIGDQIGSQARKRTSRGASKKLTTVVDGHRKIIEDPPFRTHVLSDEDVDPDVIAATYRDSVPDHVWSLLRGSTRRRGPPSGGCGKRWDAGVPRAVGRASHASTRSSSRSSRRGPPSTRNSLSRAATRITVSG